MALTKASLIDVNGQELILDADADTSITADTDDQIDIKVGGTDTVVITGGAMALKGATPTLTIGDAGAEDTKIVFDGNAQDYYIGLDDSADDLIIGRGSTVGTTPNIQINESNEVHISPADSDVKLFIGSEGGAFGGNSSHFIRASGNDLMFNSADDYMYESGGSEVMRLLNDGNLLLGTTSASASEVRIDVQYSANPIIQVKDTTNNVAVWMQATDSVAAIVAPQDGPLVFNVGASQAERARFTTDNVFLNQTATADSGVADGRLEITRGSQHCLNCHVAGTGNSTLVAFINDNGFVGGINTNGSATAFNTSSDARLKNVLGDAKGLEVINALNAVNFEWKSDGKIQDGLIAQEVEKVFPDAVSEPELDGEWYSVDYSKLVTPLIKGMQEQQVIIEDLKARIETLEG